MHPMNRTRLVFMPTVVFLFVTISFSQIQEHVLRVAVVNQPSTGRPLTVNAELLTSTAVDRVELSYRVFGRSEFKRIEMMLNGNVASATIPAEDVSPPFIEYYLLLHLRDMERLETYPLDNAVMQPLRFDIPATTETYDQAITFMTPEVGERVFPDELFISFSLLRADSSLDRSSLKIFLDEGEITSQAMISGDLVMIDGSSSRFNLPGGTHSIRIELNNTSGDKATSTTRTFTIVRSDWGKTSTGRASIGGWSYRSTSQVETRSEAIAGTSTPYNRLTLSVDGHSDQFQVGGSLYLTNEEKSTRQPQNRFFIGGESPWLSFGYGDSYPRMTSLIMSGRRVRGLSGSINVGSFRLDVVKGDIVRRIESDILKTFLADSLASEQQADPTASYGLYDPASSLWGKFRYGTFNRDILLVRPVYMAKSTAHLGFTYLKSKDDMKSIRFGGKPQENLVAGVDFSVPIHDRLVELTAQAAFSATNKDITHGTFSDYEIDSVIYTDYSESRRDNIRNLRDVFSRYITVNENLVPLNMTNIPTLAYETAIALNLPSTFLKLTYLRHGNSFESFGESTIRTDVEGYDVSGRTRFPGNQISISGGFERLQDNTAKTKPATTTGVTANSSISYISRTEIPNITLGYIFASNDNALPNDSLFGVNDKTHRILVQLGKQFRVGAQHNATLGLSTSSRKDDSPKHFDTRNTSVVFSAVSSYSIPLQTVFSLSANSTKYSTFDAVGGRFEVTTAYTTAFAQGQYRLIENKLNVSGSLSSTFGDIQRMLIDARAQYSILQNLNAFFQLSFYLNKSSTNDTIISLMLRADV